MFLASNENKIEFQTGKEENVMQNVTMNMAEVLKIKSN